ncbi:hypothetical protein FAUST_7708 [Fusarium austroamericanum]|uniref:Heterokaryon incompatibility domain-containing protein n=1 Tax=Fusarium austroamericanum TaxID=282268 RepID=A0AAN6BXY8_FUSAU|nr:hypothetical protein FAUST_7708 [Fusarium austroamericanum]
MSDSCFKRSWTFQESTAAYVTILLIKCDKSLIVADHLGNFQGEIQLPFCTLSLVLCKLCKTFGDYQMKALWFAERAAEIGSRHSRLWGGYSFVSCDWNILDQNERLRSLVGRCTSLYQDFEDHVFQTLPQWVHGNRYRCFALEAVQRLFTRECGFTADKLAILSNLCTLDIRLDATKLERLSYDLAASFLCLSILNGDLSLVRLEDGTRYDSLHLIDWETAIVGISKGAEVNQSMIDLMIGPPLFSWAPCLIQGLTESWRTGRPGAGRQPPSFRYHFSFEPPNDLLHIKGWLWKHEWTFDLSHLAKLFYRRRFNDTEWTERHDKSDLPGPRCDLQNCCKISDQGLLRQCFWDLIQFFIQKKNEVDLAEIIWASLLISEMSDESNGGTRMPDGSNDDRLRQRIHALDFDGFSNMVRLRNVVGDKGPPQFWMIQLVIHNGKLGLWRFTSQSTDQDVTHRPCYAFFYAQGQRSIFTPYRIPFQSVSRQEALDLQQYSLSWEVNVAGRSEATAAGSESTVSIISDDENGDPIKGFWDMDNRPAALYPIE